MRQVLLSAGAAFVLLAILFHTGLAGACPDCPAARAARAQILGEGWAANARTLLIALLPFILIGLVTIAAERIGKRH